MAFGGIEEPVGCSSLENWENLSQMKLSWMDFKGFPCYIKILDSSNIGRLEHVAHGLSFLSHDCKV